MENKANKIKTDVKKDIKFIKKHVLEYAKKEVRVAHSNYIY